MIQEIICLAILYICLVGWANAPKQSTTTAPIAASTAPTPQPKAITQPMPKPAYTATAPKAIETTTTPKETTPPAQDLAALPIRTLYKLASAKGIKGVKSKSKATLVELLS